MKKQFLETGKIVTTHGIKGEVKVQPWCDDAQFLTEFSTLYLSRGQQALQVQQARVHKNMVILKLEGIDTVEQAVALRNKTLFINREDVQLKEGELFVQDLIGCTVLDIDTGADYGKIYDVQQTGANDVYYLKDDAGKVRLVPVIESVVLEKDIDAQIVRIRPLEGLFDA